MGFDFIPASTTSLAAFLTIVLSILLAIAGAIYSTYRKLDLANKTSRAGERTRVIMFWIIVWLIVFCGAVETGYARENPMPGIPMLFLTVALTTIAFAFSPIGTKLANGTAIQYLVLFQVFRLPLELVLHQWAAEGVIPRTMTWTGQNYDILTGIIALIAFPFAAKFRFVARFANILGLAFLLNVIRVALFSSPTPFAWDIEPKLQLITHAPYALIGPVCIGSALLAHILLFRKLAGYQTIEPAQTPRLEHV